MIRTKINDHWQFTKGSVSLMSSLMGGMEYAEISLPHDAMVHEERTPDTGNGTQSGYWPGGNYTYLKTIHAPKEWQDKTIIMEFEGVYATAMVYVNDNLAATQKYGYSNFYVTLDKYLNYGEDNEIMVIASNEQEKNSRWYSGSGIYRNVNLLVGSSIHIAADGVKITTPLVGEEVSDVEIETTLHNITRGKHKVMLRTTITYQGDEVARDITPVTMFPQEPETVRQRVAIMDARLWDTENPNLYECKVEVLEGDTVLDEADETFGIRELSLDAVYGLRINGKQVKLRGTCIHHDNGIIGATTLEMAEERRCRQMKEAGFNSIRSAHHPMSKEMLHACDKYGMLVMDELTDMWTKHKNPNDFALDFLDSCETEIRRMVAKDYNHPSVIFYSAGNEIPETGTERGAQINRKVCNLFHDLDASRYTTNAINGMLALGAKMGIIIQELMAMQAKKEAAQPKEAAAPQSEEGASALNSMLAIMTGAGADYMSSHKIMTETIEEASLAMDTMGMNYLTGRHELEKDIHPNRCVLPTETYPADIVRLWDIVERNNNVLGDYTWTGYDYLGEAGCGIFYYDGTQNFNGVYPDRTAYIGDIDIIGYRRPISYLREVVYGLKHEPYIAVERVDKYGLPHSQTGWMLKDNIASWTWPGYEGKPANVDVYSDAEEVELLVNGKSIGRQPAGREHGYTASFALTYEPGTIEAVNIRNGAVAETMVLKTAEDKVSMDVTLEGEKLHANGADLAFVTVKLVDDKGVKNLNAKKKITVHVTGEGTLQGFGSANPRAIGSYDDVTWETYDGYVLAVVRAGEKPGRITVTFTEEETKETKEVVIVTE